MIISKTFHLIVNPVSVNNAYYKRNKQYNQLAREYRAIFLNQLNSTKNRANLTELCNKFDKQGHSLHMDFQWFIPSPLYFTKKGYISRKSKDVDNLLKLPIDFLTQDKYGSSFLSTLSATELKLYSVNHVQNLGIDDQFINKLTISKFPHSLTTWQLKLIISIHDLPTNEYN